FSVVLDIRRTPLHSDDCVCVLTSMAWHWMPKDDPASIFLSSHASLPPLSVCPTLSLSISLPPSLPLSPPLSLSPSPSLPLSPVSLPLSVPLHLSLPLSPSLSLPLQVSNSFYGGECKPH